MNGENNNNNNNNYNLNTGMNSDAFNVFNQTPVQPVQQQPVVVPPTGPSAPIKPVVEQPTEALMTVNDYKPPKEPFSIKGLLRKKVEEEEKKIDINDISSFIVPKKSDEEIEMEKEEKKKKKDLIVLIVLIVVLIVMGIVAFNIFSNYMLPSKNNIPAEALKTNIEEVKEPKKKVITTYDCDKPLDIEFYKIPHSDLINMETYKGYNEYIFEDDSLSTIEESFTFIYNEFPEGVENEIIKYCNSYNVVYDAYKMLCKYNNNLITIKDTFFINKLDSNEVVNKDIKYSFIYNNKTNSAKLLEDDTTCKLKQGN